MTQDEMYKLIAERDAAIMRAMLANQRADSADKRVDELEAEAAALRAQLDAQRWRPVTEPLPDDLPPGRYLVGKRVGKRGVKELATLHVDGFRGSDGVYIAAQWYMPIPAAPDEEARP